MSRGDLRFLLAFPRRFGNGVDSPGDPPTVLFWSCSGGAKLFFCPRVALPCVVLPGRTSLLPSVQRPGPFWSRTFPLRHPLKLLFAFFFSFLPLNSLGRPEMSCLTGFPADGPAPVWRLGVYRRFFFRSLVSFCSGAFFCSTTCFSPPV